jgi:hypothetical protein
MRCATQKATGARLLLIWFISFSLFLFAIPVLGSSPDTQCVTAPVQQIAVPIYNVCGCKIGVTLRAPHKGEPGFMQCHCNPKQAAKAYSSQSKPTLFVAQEHTMPRATRPRVALVTGHLTPLAPDAPSEPSVQPPNAG